MYSLVLMTALTTGGNAPECCFFRCDPYPCCWNWCYPCGWGCGRCWGYPWYNSYVSYYNPCWCGYPCAPVVVIREKGEMKKEEKGKKEMKEKKKAPLEAKLLIELPADASLFVDGARMKSGSAVRGVVTPPLQPGQSYYYEVKVELVRRGHTIRETRRIQLIPGEVVTTRFTNLENRAAAVVQAENR